MLGLFILGVCLLAAILLAGRWFLAADPAALARALRLAGAGLLGAAALFFALTGRFAWGMPLGLAALALLRRWRLAMPGGTAAGDSAGRSSTVETGYLRMTLEHQTGVMRGEVRRGRHAGRELSELDLAELLELLAECRREDAEAARLLEAYLERIHGSAWREASTQDRTRREQRGGGQRGRRAATGGMTAEEARAILGVSEEAGPDQIRDAHRRLMMQLHPDRGGSDYLAAKINQAKDVLLGT
jgi:hypothetical protein